MRKTIGNLIGVSDTVNMQVNGRPCIGVIAVHKINLWCSLKPLFDRNRLSTVFSRV